MSQNPPYPPPGSGPPGYPPPGYIPQPPPPPSGAKTGLVVVLAVVALVVLAGGAFALLRDDDDGGSPVETVRAFQDASASDDCEAAVDLLTEESWTLIIAGADGSSPTPRSPSRADAIQSCRENSDDVDETLDHVEVISEEGNRAVVTATVTSEGETADYQFVLAREDGAWKIDLVASAQAGLGG